MPVVLLIGQHQLYRSNFLASIAIAFIFCVVLGLLIFIFDSNALIYALLDLNLCRWRMFYLFLFDGRSSSPYNR